MNLQTAIAEREYRFKRYLEAQKEVNRLAKMAEERAETERVNRKLKNREVAELCGVSEVTVSRWKCEASTYKGWCEFLKGYKTGKYYERLKRNFKTQIT